MSSFFDDDKQVVPLIICRDGNYEVCDETLQWLESLGDFGVIACAGKYRTGKSFLLNRLAKADSNVGFGVGDSVQACTKGLWMYKKAFESNGKRIVFVDTEGIDALDANDTHDVRIFTLALLLSSAFIYNSMGPIDETALQTLSLMTRVTENVKFDTQDDIKDLAPHMPKFYWILRDFSLKLTNKDNEEITEDEYLEQALQTSSDPNKNTVRDAIRNSFPKRSLVTLPRPSATIDPSAQRMEDRLMSLSRSFVTGVDSLRNRLFDELNPMKAQDSTINGKMYSILCRHYAEVVQTNAVPVIKDSWTLIASVQARDLKDDLLAECCQILSTMKPKPKEALDEEMNNLKRRILEKFDAKSMKPVDAEVRGILVSKMNESFESSRRQLEINISQSVEKSLERIEPEISKKPEQLSIILNTELAAFSEEFGNEQAFIKAWMVTASERALCRWIPRSLQTLCAERDSLEENLKSTQNKKQSELDGLREECEASLRQEKINLSELEQKNASNEHTLNVERDENLRLRSESIILMGELRMCEKRAIMNHHEAPLQTQVESHPQLSALEEELSQTSIDCAELRASLSMEKSNHEKSKRMYDDVSERLEKAMSLQAEMEQNWKDGIEKLRIEQQHAYNNQKKDFDDRMNTATAELSKIQGEYEKVLLTINDLTNEKKRLNEKLEQEVSSHEKSMTNVRETSQRYREQSDKAQSRVLEIHKSMLDDLRMRDDRGREQQSKYLKETGEYQQRISELSRENDSTKSELQNSKRRLVELETIEIDCKRLKSIQKEKEILIAQLRTEGADLRSTHTEMMQEREILRKENMKMEGELSLLRAEKQMNEVRRAMTSNSRD